MNKSGAQTTTKNAGVSRLERSGESPFVPTPRAARADDYVYTSSIYPIDEKGHAVTVDPLIGLAGPSTMEVQARRCFESLKQILHESGSSLEKVIKVEVHLVDGSDFFEFNRVWREYFPVNPPARTAVEVGDGLPFPGALLNIDAIFIHGGSKLKCEMLQDPEGNGAVEVEGASHAVRAGSFVFCSAFPASNFETGMAVARRPGFPNYGSEAEMQAEYVFTRLNRVLAQVGTSLEHAVESQLYEPDLSHFHDVDGVWKKFMNVPPPRSSMGVKGLIYPGAIFVANIVVMIPDGTHIKEESHAGIKWHPTQVRKVNFSPTVKAGPWRFIAGQIPSADFNSYLSVPDELKNHRSEIEEQTRFTIEMLREQLEANDTDWDHCFHARVYLVEPLRDYRGFMRVWREYFPDTAKAPVLAYVPSTGIMFPGPLIEIDPTCVVRG